MSAVSPPRQVIAKSSDFVKLTGVKDDEVEEAFLNSIKNHASFRKGGAPVPYPNVAFLEKHMADLEFNAAAIGSTAPKSKSKEGGFRVDHEPDLCFGLADAKNGGPSPSFVWARWDVQKGGDSCGSVAVPVDHWVRLSFVVNAIKQAPKLAVRVCIWEQNGQNELVVKGKATKVPSDPTPVLLGMDSMVTDSTAKKSKK